MKTFTLSRSPESTSLIVSCFGTILEETLAVPQGMQYVRVDRNITLALDVVPGQYPFITNYAPAPSYVGLGTFKQVSFTGVSGGARNGNNTVFTLPEDPALSALLVSCFGFMLERVAANPGQLEYTASGAGNRTITLGMGPAATGYPFQAFYVADGATGWTIERMTGPINDVNTSFTLSQLPVDGTILAFFSGIMLESVSGTPAQLQYARSGQNVTLGIAPKTGQSPPWIRYWSLPA